MYYSEELLRIRKGESARKKNWEKDIEREGNPHKLYESTLLKMWFYLCLLSRDDNLRKCLQQKVLCNLNHFRRIRSSGQPFVRFGKNELKLILKSPRFVPLGVNLNQFGAKPDILVWTIPFQVAPVLIQYLYTNQAGWFYSHHRRH